MDKLKVKKTAFLFTIGFLGVLSTLPLLPQLLALQAEEITISLPMLQLVTTLQSSVMLLGMVLLGMFFSQRVSLKIPTITALLESNPILEKLKPQLFPALIGGVVGGLFIIVFSLIFLAYLPTEFLVAANDLSLPWYTKILYGGITEEILIRWGLMSFFTWGSFRITQSKNSALRPHNYKVAILLSALLFGVGHLPIVFTLSPVVTTPLVVYIIVGNAGFGLIAGYLFWKHGLESAIISHMVAHLTMLVAELFL